MKYLIHEVMACGCKVFYDHYLDGCCELCESMVVDIDHIEYCDTHSAE